MKAYTSLIKTQTIRALNNRTDPYFRFCTANPTKTKEFTETVFNDDLSALKLPTSSH
jgi:hypothetical protein